MPWVAVLFIFSLLSAAVCVRAITHAAIGFGATGGHHVIPQRRGVVVTMSGLLLATAFAVLGVLVGAFITVVNQSALAG